VKDVGSVDEKVFFKSHDARMECVSKLAMDWQWLGPAGFGLAAG
jgi:hypothetical protein